MDKKGNSQYSQQRVGFGDVSLDRDHYSGKRHSMDLNVLNFPNIYTVADLTSVPCLTLLCGMHRLFKDSVFLTYYFLFNG